MSAHPSDRLQATEDLIVHRLAARAVRRRRELADHAVAVTSRLAPSKERETWNRTLQVKSIGDICRLLTSRSDEAYQLRQDSPFTRLQHRGLDFTDEAFRHRLSGGFFIPRKPVS